MRLVGGIAIVLTLAAALSMAAAWPRLSQPEQDAIAVAVLARGKPDHPVYLSIRGRDPDPRFLSRLGSPLCRPYSRKPGDGTMGLVVGSFILRAPDTAEGDLQQVCGALCGCRETATVRKVQGRWIVQDVKTTVCS